MLRRLGFTVVLMLLAVSSTALAQSESARFHGSAPGHKIDYRGFFDKAENLADSPAGQAVLQDCLAAYGGQEKLASLEGVRIRYEYTTETGRDGQEIIKTFAPGRRYRTIKGIDTRLINGLTCWYEHEDQVAKLDNTRYRAELFSYLTLTMPLTAKTENFTAIRHGKKDNDDLDYLYFAKSDSLMMILGIDPTNHLIKSSVGIVPQGEQDFVYINEFSDFQSFDGFIFPKSIVYFSLGIRMGESIIQEVTVNPDFAPGEFLPRNKTD